MPTDPGVDDAALVRASQGGDQEAFGVLVGRHARSVLSVATRMIGATADAEDVAQDVFVAAFKALPRFEGDAKFSTWLYRIAVNKCTDWLRARRPGVVTIDPTEGDGDTAWAPVNDETPLWELEQGELAWELDRAVQALPHLYREAFVLRHIEGLDYAEMSAVLGVGRDTLKMRVYKARTLLCQSLAHLAVVR